MSIINLSVWQIWNFKNLALPKFAISDNFANVSGLNMLVDPVNDGKSIPIETLYLANNNLEMIQSFIKNLQSNNGYLSS